MNRLVVKPLIWIAALAACLALCCLPSMAEEAAGTRVFVDGLGREVEIPAEVERIVCTGVGALRYVCYMGAQGVVGVEQYETEPTNAAAVQLCQLRAVFVASGDRHEREPDAEAILDANPQVIVMSAYIDGADDLQSRTGIPVVVVPTSDTTLDDNAFETFRLLGELFGMEDRGRR